MSYYGGNNEYGRNEYGNERPPPPPVNRPWYAEWEPRERRYLFINEQTGERQFHPPQSYGGGPTGADYDGGYGGRGPGPARYGNEGMYDSEPRREEHKSHHSGMLGAALGAAAGLAGGAFLMHEGHEAKEHYEYDKDRVEADVDRERYRVDEFGERVEDSVQNFPDNAAEWTGRKVGEIEDIPQDVEQGFDRVGDRIEDGFEDVVDAPERVAGWVGDKVGDVERFGDNVDNAYDEGRAEGRYEGDRW